MKLPPFHGSASILILTLWHREVIHSGNGYQGFTLHIPVSTPPKIMKLFSYLLHAILQQWLLVNPFKIIFSPFALLLKLPKLYKTKKDSSIFSRWSRYFHPEPLQRKNYYSFHYLSEPGSGMRFQTVHRPAQNESRSKTMDGIFF